MTQDNNRILFSIIVPTYNRVHLIERTLDSILAQEPKNFEVIVVDDGSTDNTEEFLIKKYNNQIKYFKKTNEDRSIARNFGTTNSCGKYVIWFDSDDIMYPGYLETAKHMIRKYNNPEVITFSYDCRDDSEKLLFMRILSSNIQKSLFKGNPFSCNAMVVRSDIAKSNPFNAKLFAGEDYELWLRLASQYNFVISNQITSAIILHEERSENSMADKEKLILRFEKFLKYTTENQKLMDYLGNKASYFVMKNYLILAVDLAHNKHKKEAIKYLTKAVKSDKKALVNKTFYATLKHLIIA